MHCGHTLLPDRRPVQRCAAKRQSLPAAARLTGAGDQLRIRRPRQPHQDHPGPGRGRLNFATSTTYDRLDRAKDSTDAKAGVTSFDYNGRADLTKVTDPRNLVTQYPRNGLGDATRWISPDTGTATHTY